MGAFILTVRQGSAVRRDEHETLDEALAAMRVRVAKLREEPDLPEVSMLRTFKPSDRVRARIEISTGKILRRREAGLDVMGDGSVVAFAGGTFRQPIGPSQGSGAEEEIYDAISEALRR